MRAMMVKDDAHYALDIRIARLRYFPNSGKLLTEAYQSGVEMVCAYACVRVRGVCMYASFFC